MIRESNHVLGDLARPELDDYTVTAVFDRREQLDAALAELKLAGIDSKQILVQGDEPEAAEPGTEEARRGRGGVVGLALGGVIGGALGALLAELMPAVGLFQQVGVLGMIIAGAVLGVALGILYGTYTGIAKRRQDVPDDTPRHRSPPPLRISIKLPHATPTDQTEQILASHGAREVVSHAPTLSA